MPRRERSKKVVGEKFEYSYYELLKYLRDHIDESFGGVAGLLSSEEFEGLGFEESEKKKLYTYLSLPVEGERVKVKSFPVLSKLYSVLLGVEVESKMKIERRQVLKSGTELDIKRNK